MAEDRGTDRASDETDKIGPEGRERRGQRIRIGKEQLAEDQPSGRTVKEEVVPLDRRADRLCDNCLAQLRAVLGLRHRPITSYRGHCIPPVCSSPLESSSWRPSPGPQDRFLRLPSQVDQMRISCRPRTNFPAIGYSPAELSVWADVQPR